MEDVQNKDLLWMPLKRVLPGPKGTFAVSDRDSLRRYCITRMYKSYHSHLNLVGTYVPFGKWYDEWSTLTKKGFPCLQERRCPTRKSRSRSASVPAKRSGFISDLVSERNGQRKSSWLSIFSSASA